MKRHRRQNTADGDGCPTAGPPVAETVWPSRRLPWQYHSPLGVDTGAAEQGGPHAPGQCETSQMADGLRVSI